MENTTSFPWLFAVLGGAIILGLIIAYGMRRNAKRTLPEKAATEAGTRRMYKSEDHVPPPPDGRP